MPSNVPLTPEAARVVAAFDLVMDIDDSTGLFESSNDALAAALRELVAVMGQTTRGGGIILSGHDVLSIAGNIEQAITYAPTEDSHP